MYDFHSGDGYSLNLMGICFPSLWNILVIQTEILILAACCPNLNVFEIICSIVALASSYIGS